tara:strand:+ start:118 stop:813 length:696 start_codon:yes stop_codon:yes gene_type:complete
MDFNQKTHNLVILNYNPGAGGKFLSLCLSLHPDFLPMQEIFLGKKMKKVCTQENSFLMVKSVLDLTMKHQTHIELGHGRELYGFDYNNDKQSQLELANDLFSRLTRQEKYFFFLTNHFTHLQNFKHFTNAKNIVIHNDEKILEARGITATEQPIPELDGSFLFDMSTAFDASYFYDQMKSLCVWLGIECLSQSRLEDLRARFVRNLKIPLNMKVKANWDEKGWFRGLAKNP